MNRFRPLVDAVQAAAAAAHGTSPGSAETRAVLAAEQALRTALPASAPSYLPYLLRTAAVGHAAHVAAAGTPGDLRCTCRIRCDSQRHVDGHRKALLAYGIAAGDPVAEITFSRGTGSVALQRLFTGGCGGPYSGDYIGRGVDRDTWGTGELTRRTTDEVEKLLLEQGWRVVTFDKAAEALTAAGFDLTGGCGLDRFHVLRPGETGPGRWRVTNPDCNEWTLRAVAVRVTKP